MKKRDNDYAIEETNENVDNIIKWLLSEEERKLDNMQVILKIYNLLCLALTECNPHQRFLCSPLAGGVTFRLQQLSTGCSWQRVEWLVAALREVTFG